MLIQAVEELIDDGLLPDIEPENGGFSFEVSFGEQADSGALIELEDQGSRILVRCVLAELSELGLNQDEVLRRWLGLSLANVMADESVLSFDQDKGIVTLHRVIQVDDDLSEVLVDAIEQVMSDADEYRALLIDS